MNSDTPLTGPNAAATPSGASKEGIQLVFRKVHRLIEEPKHGGGDGLLTLLLLLLAGHELRHPLGQPVVGRVAHPGGGDHGTVTLPGGQVPEGAQVGGCPASAGALAGAGGGPVPSAVDPLVDVVRTPVPQHPRGLVPKPGVDPGGVETELGAAAPVVGVDLIGEGGPEEALHPVGQLGDRAPAPGVEVAQRLGAQVSGNEVDVGLAREHIGPGRDSDGGHRWGEVGDVFTTTDTPISPGSTES